MAKKTELNISLLRTTAENKPLAQVEVAFSAENDGEEGEGKERIKNSE